VGQDDGLVPDANIRSTVGLICVHSKFPLHNYWRLLDCSPPAERVRLGRAFRTLDEEWLVFYATHLKNLARKGDDIDAVYSKLREEFAHIAALAGE
jgi:hypothetical protein